MPQRLAPAYLVVGGDDYLTERALAEILSGVEEVNIDEYGAESDPEDLFQALRTAPMFGDQRVVVLSSVDAYSAELTNRITDYLAEPNPSVCLVIAGSKVPAKLAEAVQKVGRRIEATKGKRTDLFGWLRSEAKTRGLTPAGDALGALVEALGEDRLALSHGLDELSLALGEGRRFGAEDVRRQFRGRADIRVFGFIDSVASRQTGEALQSLHQLLRQGESPQSLFWMLARHLRLLILAQDSPAAKVAKKLGVPVWRAEKLVRQAANFTPQELTSAYETLAAADQKMKKSEEPEELTVERVAVVVSRRDSDGVP